MKQTVKINESQLRKVVAESVKKVLKEYHPNTKNDPMKQWFKDMNDAQKVRDTMDYITKGGKNPNKKNLKESEEDFDYSDYHVTVDEVNSLKQPVFDALNNLFDNMEHCVSEEIRKEARIFAEKANTLISYIESFGNYDEWWNKQHN